MNRRARTAAFVAIAFSVAMAASACTPDTTRARVEHDVPTSFVHAYTLSEQLQGRQPVSPRVTSTECHSSVNTKEDSGPGSWGCDLSYVLDGKKKEVSLLILVDSLGCYQALDGDHRDDTIVDRATGATLPDPKAGFDGCYNVYDGRTTVSKG
jgi:hypothetical protein